jgi:hypothetical protein
MSPSTLKVTLIAGGLFLSGTVSAQQTPIGDRSVSVLAGIIDLDDAVPFLISRYRLQTALYGAAELGLGVGRASAYECYSLVTTSSAACDTEHLGLFVGSLTYGASIMLARFRPYALLGFGAIASSQGDALAFGLSSVGLAVEVRAPFAARFETGQRYLHSEGWSTHYLIGVELELTPR